MCLPSFFSLYNGASKIHPKTGVPYLVPVKWNDRTDWKQAVLLTETQFKVIIQLKNNQEQQLQFSKHEVALDKLTKEEDIIIGMEVLVKLGVDNKQIPFYATGTIVGQLRLSQYNVTLSCRIKAMPLGVGEKLSNSRVKKIEDNMMTASSTYNEQFNASMGRLGNNQVWCPSRIDARGSWLQVGLGLPYYLCSVAVKGNTGNMNEWVKTYTVGLSYDGSMFHHVKENGVIKDFHASREGLESALDVAFPYRFVRFYPKGYHNYPCMGVEVYGVGPARTYEVGQQFNIDEIRVKGDHHAPYLFVPFDWKSRNDWRLARYVSHLQNNVHVKVMPGSQSTLVFNSNDVILNLPPRSDTLYTGRAVYAPFAKDMQGMAMYAVGRINLIQNGEYLVTPICSKVQKSLPVGIGSAGTFPQDRIKQIPDSQLSATSSYTNYEAKYGRLGNKKVWCASSDQL
ncbi:uncharacterized protein LOC116300083, partial [Actinia tenebrosa]|uniref:Uncharacterized protein LOC116300083 n=1 Tax=Actinia tenebrosa TaxID=6105 RepID=A0A6P8IDY2_ACTTE